VSWTRTLLLGSGGWIPTSKRETCSALVRNGRHALLIDAGTGLSRLVDDPGLLEGAEAVDIVITHFHLDHVVGLAYLPALGLAESPRLHAPGRRLYGENSEDILERLVGAPLFALDLPALVSEVCEIGEGPFDVGPWTLRTRRQERHNHPTLALRLEDELTYCTDTAYDEGNAAFAAGSRVLCHEAWFTEDAPREESTHSSAAQAAELALAAGVDALVLIHVRPGADDAPLLEEARSRFAGAVVGADLMGLRQ
jgi:ribonuclease BN (tRNA processing enzyme)